jgi:hypothetical protein
MNYIIGCTGVNFGCWDYLKSSSILVAGMQVTRGMSANSFGFPVSENIHLILQSYANIA